MKVRTIISHGNAAQGDADVAVDFLARLNRVVSNGGQVISVTKDGNRYKKAYVVIPDGERELGVRTEISGCAFFREKAVGDPFNIMGVTFHKTADATAEGMGHQWVIGSDDVLRRVGS